jgi:hypothetical protein
VLWGVSRGRIRYIALYDMNRATPTDHRRFLDRVGAEMERF